MKTCLTVLALGTALLTHRDASAVSPADLQGRIDAGERITVVDVRSAILFQKGHLPGAINIPATLIPQKDLPPLGTVVVYDDGLGADTATPAAAALSRKAGIAAEAMTGGYAGWETARGNTTSERGVKPEELPVITYARLKAAESQDVVLVDLRQPAAAATGIRKSKLAAVEPLTDLQAEFPKARVIRSPFEGTTQRMKLNAASAAPPLLVLIDSGDGSAQAMARTLKANGVTRFAILAGGEEIITRKGQAGLQRSSTTILSVQAPSSSSPTTQP